MSDARPLIQRNARGLGWCLLAVGGIWFFDVLVLVPPEPGAKPWFLFLFGLLFVGPGIALLIRNRSWKWWSVVAPLLVLLAYRIGYATHSQGFTVDDMLIRDFRSRWMCTMYWPLGWYECRCDQRIVILRWPLRESQDGKHGFLFRPENRRESIRNP